MSRHVAVWIDHQQARLFHVQGVRVDEQMLAAQSPHHRHARGAQEAKQNAEAAKRFFGHVAAALDGAEEILVLGPSSAKHELVSYMNVHAKHVASKVVGVEAVDHPTDGQLVALANKHFGRIDALL